MTEHMTYVEKYTQMRAMLEKQLGEQFDKIDGLEDLLEQYKQISEQLDTRIAEVSQRETEVASKKRRGKGKKNKGPKQQNAHSIWMKYRWGRAKENGENINFKDGAKKFNEEWRKMKETDPEAVAECQRIADEQNAEAGIEKKAPKEKATSSDSESGTKKKRAFSPYRSFLIWKKTEEGMTYINIFKASQASWSEWTPRQKTSALWDHIKNENGHAYTVCVDMTNHMNNGTSPEPEIGMVLIEEPPATTFDDFAPGATDKKPWAELDKKEQRAYAATVRKDLQAQYPEENARQIAKRIKAKYASEC